MSPGIFVVARAYEDPVWDRVSLLELPTWEHFEMYGNGYQIIPLLDGLVH